MLASLADDLALLFRDVTTTRALVRGIEQGRLGQGFVHRFLREAGEGLPR